MLHAPTISWWSPLQPPLRVSRTATYAHAASTRRAVLSLVATGLTFAALGVAFFTTVDWLFFNPFLWEPVRSFRECLEEQAFDALLACAAVYAAVVGVFALAAEAAVWVTSRRLQRGGERPALSARQKTAMGVKAVAASSPVVLWTGIVLVALAMFGFLLGPPPTTAPWYTTVARSLPVYALPLVAGTGLIWGLVVATRCATKTVDHAYRVRCVRCGYDLQGTPGNRCSECGMALPPLA